MSEGNRELRLAAERLEEFLAGHWDLTRDLSLAGADPFTMRLDAQWRRFRTALLKALLEQESTVAQSAAAAARNSARTRDMQERMSEMKSGMAGSVAALAQVVAGANEAAASVAASAELVERTHETSTQTAGRAAGMASAIGEIAAALGSVSEQLTGLDAQSRQVADLSQVVRGIAQQVNLLSLNASIEAARAAEHGRGFQVVAMEIRRLAEHTARQAGQIEKVIAQVSSQLGQASSTMVGGLSRANELTGQVQDASASAADIDKLIVQVAVPFQQLFTAMQEHATTLSGVSATVAQIAGHTERMSDHVNLVAAEAGALLGLTQRAQSQLAAFYKGSTHDAIRAETRALALDLGRTLEQAIDRGQVALDDVLALEYTEIKGSRIQDLARICKVEQVPPTGFNPPKYATRYDRHVDLALRNVLDRYLAARPGLFYTSILDLNGYTPITNAATCQDWTGDFKHDAMSNRLKRLITDLAQLEAARLGLQAPAHANLSVGPYLRDMKTVLSRSEFQRLGNSLRQEADPPDLSTLHTFAGLSGKVAAFCAAPVYVKGWRFGVALMGWEPK